jgi:hypothetical protein
LPSCIAEPLIFLPAQPVLFGDPQLPFPLGLGEFRWEVQNLGLSQFCQPVCFQKLKAFSLQLRERFTHG